MNSEEQLRKTYKQVQREMAAARIVDGALEQGAAAAEAVQEDGIIDQVTAPATLFATSTLPTSFPLVQQACLAA